MDENLEMVDGANDAPHRGPKYLPLYDQLRTRLENGEFAVGALLPTEDKLCSEFGVSRYTLREALRLLERHGYIRRRRRAGTRVLARPSKSVLRHGMSSRSEMLDFVSGTEVNFSEPRLIETDSRLARLLGCDELRRWYLLEGIRIDVADQRPMGITQVYVDASRATPPPDADFGRRPVYQWFEEVHNIHATRVSQDIIAVLLSEPEAEVFGERAGAPALRVIRRYFDDAQRIYLIGVTTHRSEDFVFSTRFHLER